MERAQRTRHGQRETRGLIHAAVSLSIYLRLYLSIFYLLSSIFYLLSSIFYLLSSIYAGARRARPASQVRVVGGQSSRSLVVPGISCVGWLVSPLIPGVVSELVPLDEPRGHALVQRGHELLPLLWRDGGLVAVEDLVREGGGG